MTKKILIPVDINNELLVKKLIKFVAYEEMNEDVEFHFVTVVPYFSQYDELSGSWSKQSKRYKHNKAEKKLREIVEIFSLPEDKCNYHIKEGKPKDEILACIKSLNVDLAMIPSSFPDISTYFFGSTALAVVRHAKCTVFVVR
ncbi:universal stress protein [Enterobacter sp. SLBN-59]|uniref:universal stress protein n=1 Tax=Enterobacter sp. SLBN-59 TaxID=2940621 RepID=UPI0021690AA6|nr:universal stress protein [Enterobacter sp. SLBN-59]MCS3490652.1 nucleotide-binding universal stress UspA family protein [Enterobacter sp. SLBN-59]